MQEKIGLDVSEYQGKSVGLMWIPWKINILYTLFSFGHRGNDRLTSNLKIGVAPKKTNYPGAYHYYRPNENSLEQALFIKTVSLRGLPGFRY
jgi:lysozyme